MNKRLREIRETLNLTQKDFSEKIGFAQATYSQIENGLRNINERIIKLLCKTFDVNEEWFRTGKGEMFTNESDLLEILGSKLNELDDVDRKILIEYLKLPVESKKVMKEYFKRIFN